MQGLIFLVMTAGVVYVLATRSIDKNQLDEDDKKKFTSNWFQLVSVNICYFCMMGFQYNMNFSHNILRVLLVLRCVSFTLLPPVFVVYCAPNMFQILQMANMSHFCISLLN